MDEVDKMRSSQLANTASPEIQERFKRAKKLLLKLNAMSGYEEECRSVLEELIPGIPASATICPPFCCDLSVTIARKERCFMANKSNDLAHTKWMCKYHIVFTPKYRRKIIYNQLKEDIRDILKQLCAYKGVEIIEGHLMPDHIHMLVSIPPKMSVSSFMGYLKGKSALMIFDRHANLKYKFGNRHFWSEGYYVSTVGLNEATIKKYIQDQEKYDIMQDKLSVKEYEDPFKG